MRTVIAFLVAPALLAFDYLGLLSSTGDRAPAEIVLFTLLPVSYVVTFGLGFPAHMALRWMQVSGLTAYVVSGFLIAGIANLAYVDSMIANWHVWWGSISGEIPLAPVHTLAGPAGWWLYGTLGGGLFWLLARPDQQRRMGPATHLIYEGPHRRAR